MTTTISADNGSISGSAGLKMTSDSSGVLALQTGANTTAVTVDASGRFLLNTTSTVASAGRLQVVAGSGQDPLYIQSTAVDGYSAVNFYNNSGTQSFGVGYANASAGVAAGTGYIYTGGATPITFFTNGSERARIDSSGNLGLGVTPSAWGIGKAIEVGYAGNGLWGVQSSGDMRVTSNIYYDGTNYKLISGGSYASYYRQANGLHSWLTSTGTTAGNATFTQAMTLDASGNLTVPAIYTNTTAAVTYVAVSSAGLLQRGGVSALKYKQDVRDLESIDINKFRAVRYKSKCENDDKTLDHFGFIADEVLQQGLTELITFDKDGEVEGFQYERMCVVLLKNAQTQAETINALTARLTALENK